MNEFQELKTRLREAKVLHEAALNLDFQLTREAVERFNIHCPEPVELLIDTIDRKDLEKVKRWIHQERKRYGYYMNSWEEGTADKTGETLDEAEDDLLNYVYNTLFKNVYSEREWSVSTDQLASRGKMLDIIINLDIP